MMTSQETSEEDSNSCTNSYSVSTEPTFTNDFHQFTVAPSIQCSPSIQRKTRRKVYPKTRPYSHILHDVVFVLSGFINPKRRKLKDLALSMGATYQVKWSSRCTHLICSFKDTLKFHEAKSTNGKIVKDRWIVECSRQKMFVDWRDFQLTSHNCPESEEDADVDDDMDFALQQGYGLAAVW